MKKAIFPAFLALAAAACGPKRLTESQEYYVGRGVAANAIAESPLGSNEPLEKYVSLVGYCVALESDRPETFKGYQFGVLQSDSINAFAAPGGFVFVTTGALKAMQNEDELAGVLAHEIAHVNLRHPEESANRASQKAGAMDLLGGVAKLGIMIGMRDDPGKRDTLLKLADAFGKVLDDLAQEIVNGYGRESELQADTVAVDLLSRQAVGYDPNALKAFVARLPKKDRGAWSTHPELEGRVQNIENEMQKRGVRAVTDPARTKRFQEATAALRR
jgi:predicted Zn-dependent protease